MKHTLIENIKRFLFSIFLFISVLYFPAIADENHFEYNHISIFNQAGNLSADDSILTHSINNTIKYRFESIPYISVIPDSDIEMNKNLIDIQKLWDFNKEEIIQVKKLLKTNIILIGRHIEIVPGEIQSEFCVIYLPLDETIRKTKFEIRLKFLNIDEFQVKIFEKLIKELPFSVGDSFWTNKVLITNYNAFWLLGMGLQQLEHDNHNAAINALIEAVKKDPGARDIYFLLGQYYATSRFDYKQAIYYLDKTLEIQNNDPVAYYWQGFIYYLIADYESAIISFEKSYNILPEKVETILFLATLYEEEGNYDFSETFYRKAIKLVPNRASTWYSLASVLSIIGKNDAAINALRRTLELDNKSFFDLVKTDTDFAAMKHNKDFIQLIEDFR